MNKRVGVQEEATACSRRKLDAARSMRRSERHVKEEARTRGGSGLLTEEAGRGTRTAP